MSFFNRLISSLEASRIDYALVGGYAVSLHGAVRGTVDVDLLVNVDRSSLERVEACLKSLGLVSKIPVTAVEMAQFRQEYIEKKGMKVWGFVNPNLPSEMVDLMVLFELKDFKVVKKSTAFGVVKVVSILDLIKMKELAARPQDLADIDALKKCIENNKGN